MAGTTQRRAGAARPPRAAGPAIRHTLAPTTRAALRGLWRASGKTWDAAPPRHKPRNLAIASAYLDTDEPLVTIAARHGLSRARVPVIARTVVFNTLGRRLPCR